MCRVIYQDDWLRVVDAGSKIVFETKSQWGVYGDYGWAIEDSPPMDYLIAAAANLGVPMVCGVPCRGCVGYDLMGHRYRRLRPMSKEELMAEIVAMADCDE